MKKYLLLAVMVLSFNASAKDIEDMDKQEVRVVHIELYEALIANTTEEKCKEFDAFGKKAGSLRKFDILDFEANDRFMSAYDECNRIGYIF
jgi:hypothetical protein